MTALQKPVMMRGGPPGAGCWAFDNTHDTSSVSGKFYSLVVPDRRVAQLDDLPGREEAEFWKLNLSVAAMGAARLERETGRPHTAFVGVNDGYYVGQSIPHVHSHIVVTEAPRHRTGDDAQRDLPKAFDDLRRIFSPAAAPPLLRARIACDPADIDDFTWRVKYHRENLRENGMDMFRVYSGSALEAELRPFPFVIDAGNSDHPMFSFSQAWRAMNGRMPFEKLAHPLGRGKYTHFEPAPSALA